MSKAYRTVLTVEVFSREPLPTEWPGTEMYDPLVGLIYDVTEGDKIGDWRQGPSEPIEGEALRAALIGIGNGGDFFDDADGA